MRADVVKLPERVYRPDAATVFKIIDDNKDDAANLYEVAKLALRGVDVQRERGCKAGPQAIANGWFIAAMALLTLLAARRAAE